MKKINFYQIIHLKCLNLIQNIENKNLDFWAWIKCFVCIVFVRIMFESVISHPEHWLGFSDDDPYYALLRLIFYVIYFVAITLPVIYILYFLIKENIIKISKIVIVFTAISWCLPIIDFILSKGKGCNMHYPWTLEQVLNAFLHFFNPYRDFSEWASAGLRIEFFLVVFFIGIYVYLKTSSLIKGGIGFALGYLWMFFLGMPLYVSYLIDMLDFSKIFNIPKVEEVSEYSNVLIDGGFVETVIAKVSLIWLMVIVFLLPVWLLIHNKKHLFELIKNIRLTRSIHYIILLISGVIIGHNQLGRFLPTSFGYAFDYLAVFSLMFSIFFAFQYAVVSNDICDLRIDQISNPKRPLVTQAISEPDYRNYGAIYLILAILFALVVSLWVFLLVCVILCLCSLYSNPPLQLKKYFPASSFLIALISLVVVLMGYGLVSGSKYFYQFPPAMALTLLLSFFFAVNIKDLKDFSGDKKGGVYTLQTILGEMPGKFIVALLTFLAFIIPVILLRIQALIPFAFLCGFIAVTLILVRKWKEELFFINYYCYFIIMMNLFIKNYHV